MSKKKKVEEAAEILTSLGLPRAQRNERSALTLLALAGLSKADSWKDVQQPLLRIWDIMGSSEITTARTTRPTHGRRFAGRPSTNSNRHASLTETPMTQAALPTAEKTSMP